MENIKESLIAELKKSPTLCETPQLCDELATWLLPIWKDHLAMERLRTGEILLFAFGFNATMTSKRWIAYSSAMKISSDPADAILSAKEE